MKRAAFKEHGSVTLIEVAIVGLLSVVFVVWFFILGGPDGTAERVVANQNCLFQNFDDPDMVNADYEMPSCDPILGAPPTPMVPDTATPEPASTPTPAPTNTPPPTKTPTPPPVVEFG